MRHVQDFGALFLFLFLTMKGEEKWRQNGDSERCEGEEGCQFGEKWRKRE